MEVSKNPVGATIISKSQMNSVDNQARRNLGIVLELPNLRGAGNVKQHEDTRFIE